jgi:hypothetical protein
MTDTKKPSEWEFYLFLFLFFSVILLSIYGVFYFVDYCYKENKLICSTQYKISTGWLHYYANNIVVTNNQISFYDVVQKAQITLVDKPYELTNNK